MPQATVILASQVVSTRKGRPTSGSVSELLAYCTTELINATATGGNALTVVLGETERLSTVQNTFREAAKNLGISVKFGAVPGSDRTYKSNRGGIATEAGSFFVTPKPLADAVAA